MRCQRVGCEETAICRVVLVLPAPPPHEDKEARGVMGLVLCEEHRNEAHIDHFMNDDSWADITQLFIRSGKTVPDRSQARLEFEPLTEPQ